MPAYLMLSLLVIMTLGTTACVPLVAAGVGAGAGYIAGEEAAEDAYHHHH